MRPRNGSLKAALCRDADIKDASANLISFTKLQTVIAMQRRETNIADHLLFHLGAGFE
jgi:hypothetical protein